MNCASLLTKKKTNKTMGLSENWTNMNTNLSFYFIFYRSIKQSSSL